MVNQAHNYYNPIQVNYSANTQSTYTRIAKITFILFLFFTFFGTNLPFQEEVTDIDDIATSNIINQVIFSLLFLLACFSLIPKAKEVIILIKREKFLSLFLLWCLLSIIWSEFSFVSFKRLFQVLTAFLVSLAIVLHTSSSDEILKYFKSILAVYLILSVLSILLIPGAKNEYGLWRGLMVGKNYLGQTMLICLIIWFNVFRFDTSTERIFSFFMLLISLILLIGSRSMTSILTFSMLVFLGMLFSVDRTFHRLAVVRLFTIMVILSLMGMIVSTIYLAPEIINSGFDVIGKDSSFTGRTVIWTDIFEEAKKHLFIGCGYAGFWVIENVNLLVLYETYKLSLKQAHNGYLDLLNETGLIGLSLVILMVIFYYKDLLKLKEPHFWKWIFMAVLIINFQESSLFRPRHLTGVMFIFSYLILYAELIRQQRLKIGRVNVIRKT